MAEQTLSTEAEDDLPAEVTRYVIDLPTQGRRLDQWLAADERAHSRGYVQDLIERGAVSLDGQPCTQAAKRLRLGQHVEVQWWPPEADLAFVPEPMALDLVHEDAHLLVVNKPVGLVVHPAAGNWRGTLMNGLLAHHPAAASLPRAGIVHRLDKDTSGLMVVAKTLAAFHDLVAQLAAREVRREYLALCHGAWGAPRTVDAPIGRDVRTRIKMAVVASGRPAMTDFTPLREDAAASWLHCRLHSGRTHQIRVHAAHAGHPLVGDTLYGGSARWGLARQGLHAARLGLVHPASQQACSWRSPVPADLAAACVSLWNSVPDVPMPACA